MSNVYCTLRLAIGDTAYYTYTVYLNSYIYIAHVLQSFNSVELFCLIILNVCYILALFMFLCISVEK